MVFLWPGPRPPKPKETTGRLFRASAFPKFLGESWGKSGLKTPQFPYGYLWPGWLGWPPLPNGLGSLVPQKPWKFLRAGSRNFGWSAGVLPINFWNLGPRPPWPKETIGKMGVFNPDFFPELSPKTLGKKKGNFCCLQNSVDPRFSYGFPLAWPPGRFREFWAPENPPVSLWVAWVAAASQSIWGILVPWKTLTVAKILVVFLRIIW